jgi:hypothetical protein
MSRDASTIRLYASDLRDAHDRFVQRMWPTDAARAAPTVAPDAESPCALFVKGHDVIGHLATLPVRLSVAGRSSDAHWAVGLMVVPEYRNGPVAPLLVKKISETVEIGLTLHVDPAAVRVFKGLNWRHVGVMPQYARLLNARAVVRVFSANGRALLPERWSWMWPVVSQASRGLAALASGVVAGVAAAAGRLWHRRPAGAAIVEERQFDASYVELAERVKGKFRVWVCRDERYLASRYGHTLGRYRLLACREGTRLLGYCLVKLKQFENDSRMGDLRMGTIVDCVADPDDAGVVNWLLRSGVELCRREQMDVVFCSASHREIRRHLRWNGFLGMRGTLHVAFHDRTGGLGPDVPLEAWHLMRGDSDADANC